MKMKKTISLILAIIVIVGVIPFEALATGANENILQETTETDDYIYYSDLFYGYSSYLTQNTYLTGLESNTTNVTTSILNEYITTNHFKASAVFDGIGIASDPTTVAKYISDNIGLSNFQFNDELDKANQKFSEAICDVNLNASKDVGTDNKYIKNIKKYLDLAKNIDEISIKSEADYNKLDKPELYKTFYDRAIAMLEEYCTELTPKLPSLKSELFTALSETTEIMGNLNDAVDFAKALAVSITMQETQIELIQDVIDTQDPSSTLYKGMTRLKNQLLNGFVSYFTTTYLADKAFDKVIGYLPKLTSRAILNGWSSYGSAIVSVVKLVNGIVFKEWLGYDYSEYTSAVMLTQYAADLYNSVRKKASVFSSQFDSSEIQKFETLYNAYIAMKSAAFKECKNIAKHNPQYDLEYIDSVSDYFDTENAYKKYICGVKEYINFIPQKSRKITIQENIWNLTSNTTLKSASDLIEKNCIYKVKDYELPSLFTNDKIELTIDTDVVIPLLNLGGQIIISENSIDIMVDNIEFRNTGSYGENTNYYWNKGNLHIENSLTIAGYQSNSKSMSLYLSGGNIFVKNDLNINAKGFVYVDNNSTLNVCGNIKVQPGYDGAFSSGDAELIVNDGKVYCKSNMILYKGRTSWAGFDPLGCLRINNVDSIVEISGDFIAESSGGHTDKNLIMYAGNLYLKGNVNFSFDTYCTISGGNVFLCGNKTQRITKFPIYNVIITNQHGVSLGSDLNIYNTLNTNNSPIIQNGYSLCIKENGKVYGNSILEKVKIISNSVTLASDLTCKDLELCYTNSSLTVPAKNTLTVSRDLNLFKGASITNYGTVDIGGNLALNFADESSSYATNFYNYGKTTLIGSINGKVRGCFCSYGDSSLYIGGDFLLDNYYAPIQFGKIIFNGSGKQTIDCYSFQFPTTIINNNSADGVVFNTKFNSSVLFDHKGNNFTLYNNGEGSTFVDYDGDGLKDNVDPEPTVGNPCTLNFKSEGKERGNVSTETIETVGGTKVTVVATPTFKYNFSKWIDSSGKTVSTSAEYSFVAKCSENYTAIFTKRQKLIITRTTGGTIHAPSKAEIESSVSVSVTENDGYVYTEGSLKYNDVQIENGSFIMPDELVILTAEFVKNENYFALNEVLSNAKSYTYEAYSEDSFANLTNTIRDAEASLTNNITAEESSKQIVLLQDAINGLSEKHISSITLNTSPLLYWNVPDMINNISVLITYDNSTTLTVTGSKCTIDGFDATVIGEQIITITYDGVVGKATVTVKKRKIEQCIFSGIEDQIYNGITENYRLCLGVSYIRTNETLTENTDFIAEYSNNTAIGEATVKITGIGNYTGSRIITFKIYCEHNYSEISRTEPSCDRSGQIAEQCSVCGKTRAYKNVVTENLPESAHNYSNNCDVSYYYTDEGANSLELLFSGNTETENSYDKIYIYGKNGNLIGTYSGNALAGKNITVSGDTVRIRLTSDGSVVRYGFSLDSITSYFDHLLIPMTDHTYGNWCTITKPTPYDVGYKHRFCTECNKEVTEEIPAVIKLSFRGASLSLHHNLAVNFKADKALFEEVCYENPYVVFEINGVKTAARNYTVDGNRYVFKFRNIAPNQMNDIIYATLYATYDGVVYASDTKEYSVAEYCYGMLSNYSSDEYAKLRTLLVDLLHYGAQSQLYTEYNTDNLVDSRLTEAQLAWGTADDLILTDSLNTTYETVNEPTAIWKGAGLTLKDSITMRFKFMTDSADGLTVKIKTDTDEWSITSDKFVKSGDAYYVYFNALNASQMSENVYLTVYNGNVAVSNTVRYSIESYAYEKQNSSAEYVADLVKAMMKYGNSAYNYIN